MLLRALVKKEILNNLLNLRFSLAYFLCTFLLVGSAAIMFADYLTEKRVYDVNTSYYTRRLSDLTGPDDYLWSEKIVARPPTVTRVFAAGGERDPDLRAEVSPEFPPYFYGDFKRSPLTNLFPSVDTVFIIGVIMSLLIFVLTYDSLSGEREEGTLKVLLAGPIPRDQVIIAKWLGGFVSLIAPFVTSWLVIMLILLFTPSVSITLTDWMRIFGIWAVCTLYVGVVFSLSMMVSALIRNSTTSILTLLMVWVLGILVAPSLSSPIAYLIVKPPAVQKGQLEMRKTGTVGWESFDKRRDDYLKNKFGDKKRDDLSPESQKEWDRIRNDWFWIYLGEVVGDVTREGQAATRYESRVDDLSRWISRLSPYGCLQNACVALANTGMQRERDLRASLEDFSRNSLAFAREGKQGGGRVDPLRGPRFSFQSRGVVVSLQQGFVDICLLLVMGVLFFLLSYTAFLRMEVA